MSHSHAILFELFVFMRDGTFDLAKNYDFEFVGRVKNFNQSDYCHIPLEFMPEQSSHGISQRVCFSVAPAWYLDRNWILVHSSLKKTL